MSFGRFARKGYFSKNETKICQALMHGGRGWRSEKTSGWEGDWKFPDSGSASTGSVGADGSIRSGRRL